jgi:beta-lactamase superfamily II metal-dependent hydrolase
MVLGMGIVCGAATGAPSPNSHAKAAEFYFIDVGNGNATLIVLSSGETMLLDCGGDNNPAMRIYNVMQQHGVKQIDYAVITDLQPDHMGALAELSNKVPIRNVIDHGESVSYHHSDGWWNQHRGALKKGGTAGMGQQQDTLYESFVEARAKSHHIVAKVGDHLPITGMDAIVVAGGGKILSTPLAGAGQLNSACVHDGPPRTEDDAEDSQSLGLRLRFGKFRFVYLGDESWNNSTRLFCPANKVGKADAYLITHHAESLPASMGDYYYGLDCCTPAEVWGLQPRVAILSLGKNGHKAGNAIGLETIAHSPGFEDLWETNKVLGGGEAGHNASDDFIANTGQSANVVMSIKLTAYEDGSFTMTNSRNGFSKSYPPHK